MCGWQTGKTGRAYRRLSSSSSLSSLSSSCALLRRKELSGSATWLLSKENLLCAYNSVEFFISLSSSLFHIQFWPHCFSLRPLSLPLDQYICWYLARLLVSASTYLFGFSRFRTGISRINFVRESLCTTHIASIAYCVWIYHCRFFAFSSPGFSVGPMRVYDYADAMQKKIIELFIGTIKWISIDHLCASERIGRWDRFRFDHFFFVPSAFCHIALRQGWQRWWQRQVIIGLVENNIIFCMINGLCSFMDGK